MASHTIRRWSGTAETVVLLCLIVSVIGLALGSVSPSLTQTVVLSLATIILVVSLYVFVGNSGVFSFGHMALAMVGGYVGAIVSIPTTTKVLAYPKMLSFLKHLYLGQIGGVLAGGIAAALFGLILAGILARLSGLTAGLATFVVLLIAYSVASSLDSVTSGSSGLTGIAPASEISKVLPWTLGAIIVAGIYQCSRSCQRLRASSEDEFAASSIGIHIGRERAIAFVLSSFLAGVGGAIYAQALGTIGPSVFYLGLTTTVIAMLVIGGLRSLTGAVVGAISIAILNEFLSRLENGLIFGSTMIKGPVGLQQIVLAVAMLVILIWRRDGLTHGREVRLTRRKRNVTASGSSKEQRSQALERRFARRRSSRNAPNRL